MLDGVQIPLREGAILRGKGMPPHLRWHSAVGCAKMAEPIEMLFGLWSQVGRRKHVLDEGPDPECEGAILGERTFPTTLL